MDTEKKPNNPTAFPTLFYSQTTGEPNGHDAGMTLRDYFANSAMQAMITAMYTKNYVAEPEKIIEKMQLISTNAYWYADQMLKQREL